MIEVSKMVEFTNLKLTKIRNKSKGGDLSSTGENRGMSAKSCDEGDHGPQLACHGSGGN